MICEDNFDCGDVGREYIFLLLIFEELISFRDFRVHSDLLGERGKDAAENICTLVIFFKVLVALLKLF